MWIVEQVEEKHFRPPLPSRQVSRGSHFTCMQHVVSTRTTVAGGQVTLEVRGQSIRIKRPGMPEFFLPLEAAGAVARFLAEAATPQSQRL